MERYDAIVIGAGAGGLAAAARLQHSGYQTLLVERCAQVGGRASTVFAEDGFGINTGAHILELGGENQRLFGDLGIPMRARRARRPLVLRLGGIDLPLMSGPFGLAATGLGLPIAGAVARRWGWLRPYPGLSVDAWLTQLRGGPNLHRVARNVTSAMFAAETTDVEAIVLFDYLTKRGGLSAYGVHPDGMIGPWREVADRFRAAGGTLLLDSTVARLDVGADRSVRAARIRGEGRESTVGCRIVVSDVGPPATIDLVGAEQLPVDYVRQIRDSDRPGTLITVNFATREPVRGLDGLVFFGFTDRLAYANAVSALSPALAPPGWHLYCATSTPHPAISGFDADSEIALLKRETAEAFPEFHRSRIISVEVCTGDWPGQRAVPGRDWPSSTPLPNLWNVGDAARPWLGAGQSGCVASARLVVEQIRTSYPVADLRRTAVPTPLP